MECSILDSLVLGAGTVFGVFVAFAGGHHIMIKLMPSSENYPGDGRWLFTDIHIHALVDDNRLGGMHEQANSSTYTFSVSVTDSALLPYIALTNETMPRETPFQCYRGRTSARSLSLSLFLTLSAAIVSLLRPLMLSRVLQSHVQEASVMTRH
jgi:hypothetical protein